VRRGLGILAVNLTINYRFRAGFRKIKIPESAGFKFPSWRGWADPRLVWCLKEKVLLLRMNWIMLF
jgi:hypothetical protein